MSGSKSGGRAGTPRWPLVRLGHRPGSRDLVLDPGVHCCYQREVRTDEIAAPDRSRVRELAGQLGVPLRSRAAAAGSPWPAMIYFYRPSDDAELRAVQSSVEIILSSFRPYPAVAVDQSCNLIAANSGLALLTAGVAAHLRTLPVNLLRLSLHPDGLAGRIINLAQWRFHVLRNLAEAHRQGKDARLGNLHAELTAYPGGIEQGPHSGRPVPLRLEAGQHRLAFLCTVTSLTQPVYQAEVGLSVVAFLPADYATAHVMRGLASGHRRW